MGWDYCAAWKTIAQTKAALRAQLARAGSIILDEAGSRSWWVVTERGGERQILLFMLSNSPSGWGYKSISESMGPTDASCPVRFFHRVPNPPNDYARGWREEVRKLASRAKQTFTSGDRIRLYGKIYQIEAVGERGTYDVTDTESGKLYRMKAAQVKDAVRIEGGAS